MFHVATVTVFLFFAHRDGYIVVTFIHGQVTRLLHELKPGVLVSV